LLAAAAARFVSGDTFLRKPTNFSIIGKYLEELA
jgi:hypothetical protein